MTYIGGTPLDLPPPFTPEDADSGKSPGSDSFPRMASRVGKEPVTNRVVILIIMAENKWVNKVITPKWNYGPYLYLPS